MFSKIYSKIKEIIRENLFLIISSLIVVVVFNIPIPYYIEAPGGLINLDDKVKVSNGYDSKGSLNLTYVSTYDGSIATYIMAKLNKSWDLVPNDDVKLENEDMDDVKNRNKIMLENSISNAYYVAYTHLKKDLKINSSNLYVVYVDENADTDIKVGDKIVKIDDIVVNKVDDIKKYIQTKNVGDVLKVIVNDGDEKYITVSNIDNKKSILIYAVCNYDYDSDIEFNFKSGESGPSGGLMLSLSIYDKNTSVDLTKGKVVSGTGTIDINGNVGEISGIKYKIIGAVKKNADIFLVPYENYEEAKEVVKNNNYNIKLVCVKTFNEALNYLLNN